MASGDWTRFIHYAGLGVYVAHGLLARDTQSEQELYYTYDARRMRVGWNVIMTKSNLITMVYVK